VWNSVPGLSSGVASSEGDNLEITVSAEMYQPGGSVWFRALVDGEVAEPSDVVFKSGTVEFDGVRTFTFVKRAVKAGQHIVEIQWRTGTAARIRDRTLTVYSASAFVGPGHLAVATAPSGPDIQKKNSTYEDIPGMATTIGVSLPSTLAVVFSAEASASSGRLMVRALLDGSQVGEAIFCEAGDPNRGGTRSFTFAKSGVASGSHDVRLQWKSTDGTCRLGDRTMAVSAAPLTTQRALSSADATPQTLKQALVWTDLQTTTFNAVDPVSTVAITFSAEVQSDNGRLFLRALVDGEASSPSDVTLIQGGKKWRVASHTFIVKNLPAGRHQVQIQGMVDPSTKGQVRHRSLRVLWKRRSGSDFVQPFQHHGCSLARHASRPVRKNEEWDGAALRHRADVAVDRDVHPAVGRAASSDPALARCCACRAGIFPHRESLSRESDFQELRRSARHGRRGGVADLRGFDLGAGKCGVPRRSPLHSAQSPSRFAAGQH
jgi:hypothetical protein